MMTDQAFNYISVLSWLDWLIFATSIALTIAAVCYGHRVQQRLIRAAAKPTTAATNHSITNHSIIEYLIMGRQLTLPLFIATLTATWYGGILGVTQIAFEHGIYNLITQGIFWYISYLLFALYLVKKIRRYNAFSLPEMIKKIFGPRSAALSIILIFFKSLPIGYAIGLGILIQLFFNITLPCAIIIGVSFVVVYSFFGGLRSVIYSDLVQLGFMLFGLISVVGFSMYSFGGIKFLTTALPATHFSFTGNHNLNTTLVWIFIACATTFINPTFYHRCFAAKSDKVAIYGILGATAFWVIIDLCTTLGGMYAKAVIPNADPTNGYLIYSLQLLPNGWKGLFLASLLATVLSTLDSFLLLASSILFYDFPIFDRFMIFKRHKLSLHTKHNLSLILVGIITTVLAIHFNGKIESVLLTFKGFFAACLLFPLLIGYFFPGIISDLQFVYACLTGCFCFGIYTVLLPILLPQLNLCLDPFYIGNLATLAAIGYFISKTLYRYTPIEFISSKPASVVNL